MAFSNRTVLTSLLFTIPVISTAYAGCSATSEGQSFETSGSGASDPASSSAATGGGDDLIDAGGTDGGKTGGVPKTCAEANEQQSYIGCEYWPTITSNAGLYSGFEFAIAAANPGTSDAVVTVERQGATVAQFTVAPDQLKTQTLPWVNELKGTDAAGDGTGITSVLAAKGAFKVTSSYPIVLYQFNPLEFELASNPFDCPLSTELGGCFSFTNDASLLLPKTAMRTDYYVMSYPTLHIGYASFSQWINLPGFLAVTGTEDNTQVTVKSSASVRAGNGVNALSAGGTGVYTLNAGDVLMLMSGTPAATKTSLPGKPCILDPSSGIDLCPTANDFDLTGSHVTSDKPVSVIGGHDCTFLPYSNFACDHIEESMFPVDALGQNLVVTAPRAMISVDDPDPGKADSMFLRVLSAADANTINFDPPVSAPVTLNAGQWVEIGPIAQDVAIKAGNRILVSQYMVGENFSGASVGGGDPAISVAIPTEQYRVEYTFLAPATYSYNFVNVVAPPGATITIDGATIPAAEFVPIGSSGLSVARHSIQGGSHIMKGDQNFGITVYGYGSYTSYMYPGGLNLEFVDIVPE